MTIEEFENQRLLGDDYIVCIRLKYEWETEYRKTTEILELQSDGSHVWQNDFCEGEEDIIVDAAIPLMDITSEMLGNTILTVDNFYNL